MRFTLSDSTFSHTYSFDPAVKVKNSIVFPADKPINKVVAYFNDPLGELTFYDKAGEVIGKVDGSTYGKRQELQLKESERIVGVHLKAGYGYISELSFLTIDLSFMRLSSASPINSTPSLSRLTKRSLFWTSCTVFTRK